MAEKVELSRPLVVGRKRDGRSCYDREAKRELVEACLRPGISVARMALEHGVNANLLRRWIDNYRGGSLSVAADPTMSLPAFIPVLPFAAPKLTGLALSATLPNGVKLDLSSIDRTDLSQLLTYLAHLPCSVSTRG
ncbi:MAG: transposase [Comamonadaceae bacterium]